ncbi:D-glycero-beta-D-manno-heptose-1,7-bisphosphate 7-phosphatase [Thiohalobacter thiocyanaticus]|uniref:D-glycero-beta-D-manno-heptose-1,7-bisphosphate 7-phosphatase n=1 Tax=Thiohalobacter thiocyanaticus TaxID=585455 RepID=A0A426QJP1_9GAMM|nr:D-glycero-beta-D-manno-heptose-1,7-bisphosphate 7-phosphatase [Thiohalobacter thiocyanaticus]RRQ21984.1 D-glycero-beta-D-manno-heptose-1,7-bisphosphate 7-phosphatase [Thiohalobacter thiocyanaticus]
MQPVIIDLAAIRESDTTAPEHWNPMPGSLEAIARLNRADRRVLVTGTPVMDGDAAPDLGRLTRLHNRLNQAANNAGGQIDAVLFCPHGPDTNCPCRPPRPGLLLDIALRQQLRLEDVPYITLDHGPALEAGRSAGVRCLVLGAGNTDAGEPGFSSLDAAVQYLLDETDNAD